MAPARASTSWPAACSPLLEREVAGEPRRARVLAAFPTALYLHLGRHDLVLPVLTGDALLLPTGLRLALASAEVEWGVQAGHDVLVGDGRVRLPGRDVVSVRPWRPARVTRASSARSASIAGAAHVLGQADSSAVLRELAADLTAAGLDGRQVGRRVGALVGAGAGLTPSGDDALCGVLLALRAVGGRVPSGDDAAGAVAASVRRASAATTSLSASLLSAASEGYAVPEVVRLVDEVARGDTSAVTEALAPVLGIGHSSGADLVAGLAGALDALIPVLAQDAGPHHTEPEGARRA